jgi:transposase InsO family protein
LICVDSRGALLRAEVFGPGPWQKLVEAVVRPEIDKASENVGAEISMSGKGNCYDNAVVESFFGNLKNELVHHCRFVTREEAIERFRWQPPSTLHIAETGALRPPWAVRCRQREYRPWHKPTARRF